MKKRKCLPCFITFIILVLLSSCSDENIIDPEDPVEQTDTIHLFNYRTDTINVPIHAQFYVNDTNNVFYPTFYSTVFHYTNLNYNIINFTDPDFSLTTSNGFDSQNVFFGGTSNAGLTKSCKLCKLEGNTFINYDLNGDTNRLVENILVLGRNEVWFSTLYNVVYYFNNGNLTKYTLDSNIQTGHFFMKNGEIFLFANIYYNNGNDSTVNYTYKFTGTEFIVVSIDTTYPNSSNNSIGLTTLLKVCGQDDIRTAKSSLYYFNGNTWEILCNTPFLPLYVAGESKDNFVCYGTSLGENNFYIRKNNKWYIETNPFPFEESMIYLLSSLFYSQGRYYLLYAPQQKLYLTLVLQLMPIN